MLVRLRFIYLVRIPSDCHFRVECYQSNQSQADCGYIGYKGPRWNHVAILVDSILRHDSGNDRPDRVRQKERWTRYEEGGH
jgi:hypothetical protein